MKKKYYLFVTIVLTLFSCNMFSDVDYEYKLYKRVVGREGGTVYFFSNYANDNDLFKEDTLNFLLRLSVPKDAIDTQIVFNFYQFQDFQTACDLSEGYSCVGSQFFYFVPFLYSSGYHEHDGADLSFHETFKFNKPIEVKYYFSKYVNPRSIDEKKLKYSYYDRINSSYKIYKIRIPAYGQWGENRNIFIEINKQGYPIGYNKNDIKDIILGYWQPFSDGNKDISLANWETVDTFDINFYDNSISFQIDNTDYIYIIAKNLTIDKNDLPTKIVNYVLSVGKTIQRASLENKIYNVYTQDNCLMMFYLNGEYYCTKKQNITIPPSIVNYINTNLPGANVLSNEFFDYGNIMVLNLKTLKKIITFQGQQLSNLQYVASSEYSDDISKLPQNIISKVYQIFENPIIKYFYVNSDNSSSIYNVYLTSNSMNIEYSIDNFLNVSTTKYIGFKFTDIPDTVLNVITRYFDDINLKSVSKNISISDVEYELFLLNDGYFRIKEDGTLKYCNFYLQKYKIPYEIISMFYSFGSKTLSDSYYYYDITQTTPEKYYLEYSEGLIAEINSNSEILYLYSKLYFDLPKQIRIYLEENYSSQDFIDYYYLNSLYQNQIDNFYFVYLTDNRTLVFDKNSNFLGLMIKSSLTILKEKQEFNKKHFNKNFVR